jgi:hypothetical protein
MNNIHMVRVFQGRKFLDDEGFWNIILGIDGCIDQTFTAIFWKAFGDLIGRELQPHIDQRLPSKYQIQWIDQDLQR